MRRAEYRWQKPCQEALSETEPRQLREKADNAETTIFLRLQEISGKGDHQRERVAIEEALSNLRSLQTERLNYPDCLQTFTRINDFQLKTTLKN